jgi:hypothetical protein
MQQLRMLGEPAAGCLALLLLLLDVQGGCQRAFAGSMDGAGCICAAAERGADERGLLLLRIRCAVVAAAAAEGPLLQEHAKHVQCGFLLHIRGCFRSRGEVVFGESRQIAGLLPARRAVI